MEAIATVVAGIIAGGMMLTAVTLAAGLIIGVSCWIFSLKM